MIVFLPVRNGGKYLKRAIDSIVAQTSGDWQLVVLENASTDDTVATVEAYRDARIICLPAPVPLDIVGNWRRSAEYLKEQDVGDTLITFIGHDDYFMPKFVECITALAAASPDATLYQTAFDLVDANDRLIRPCRPIPSAESWRDLAAALCWNMRESFGTGYAFRARDFLAVGGMPDLPMLLSSDHLLFVRLTRLGYKRTDPRVGCAYRLHSGSTSGGMSRAKLNAHVEGLARLVAALVEMGLAEMQDGRDALACLLGRELWTLRLAPVSRVLTISNHRRRADLESMFMQMARGVDIEVWADPEGGGFARAIRPVRRIVRALSLHRQVRR